MSERHHFARSQRMTIVSGILAFAVLILVLQIWLLTATMNAYYDALKRKDVDAVKRTLADGYLKMLESAGVGATPST